jgi:hypothetical protein
LSQELVLQCYERVVAGYELSLTRPHALFPVADVKTQWWCVIEAEQREKERLRIEAEEKAAKAAEKAANKGKKGEKGKKDDKKGKKEEKGGKKGKGSGEPEPEPEGASNGLFEPIYNKRSFYQARLGTKVEKKRRFRRCLYRPDCVPGHGSRYWLAGERNGVFEPFLYKTDNFTRAGSGQTQGKHSNNFGHATGWQIPGIGTLAPVRTAPYTLFFAVCVSLALKPIIYQDRPY